MIKKKKKKGVSHVNEDDYTFLAYATAGKNVHLKSLPNIAAVLMKGLR